MRNKIQYSALMIVICLQLISCNNDSLRPTQTSNIPSHIIVKEKSIIGNFDSVVADYSLTAPSDTEFVGSIYDNLNQTDLFINRSRFAQNKFIYFSKDNELRDYDGDSVAMTVLFDNNNRIIGVYNQYSVNYNYPFQLSTEITFEYNNQNRLKSAPTFGTRNNGGGCSINLFEWVGAFYTTSTGMDSLVLTHEAPSCSGCYGCVDTVAVTFLEKSNNTNLATLSFPSKPVSNYCSSNNYMFFMQYLPFPKLNGKLIDKVYYFTENYQYTNTYTFDDAGRVKTAKIIYNFLYGNIQEKLIEFNY